MVINVNMYSHIYIYTYACVCILSWDSDRICFVAQISWLLWSSSLGDFLEVSWLPYIIDPGTATGGASEGLPKMRSI